MEIHVALALERYEVDMCVRHFETVLVATYGMPISVNNTVGSIGATWFGGNNGYITLTFGQNNIGPGIRYLTTLTFGM